MNGAGYYSSKWRKHFPWPAVAILAISVSTYAAAQPSDQDFRQQAALVPGGSVDCIMSTALKGLRHDANGIFAYHTQVRT
jgi:hypothetical protein